ncbi:hypothetical protein CALVIDRAFT_539033 [Calocera viscosa TUFC12733]|uniref:CENP-V/GFA domain-containing protein n=1 Tax=Calocera viscosa (strain TUFC12733) TaxID=1330018 RepID=A0A167KF76_CALVF|nr:hypothetical protein CALVIDRAFT_539033 [Calocera viscosa TUFC12733]
MTAPTIFVTCHCRAHRIPIHLDASALPHPVDFCHCLACRQSTGAPFGCYMLIPHPLFPPPGNPLRSADAASATEEAVPYVYLPEGVKAYKSSETGTRYFCATCGCHLGIVFLEDRKWSSVPIGALEFVRTTTLSHASTAASDDPDSAAITSTVSTTVSAAAASKEQEIQAVESTYTISWHQYLSETVDGGITRLLPDGLARWAVEPDDAPFVTPMAAGPLNAQFRATSAGETLTARCRCGGVRARILRPSAIPSGPGAKERGSADGQRWLSGHCFCTDCRLTSGFPVTSWTYVGREHLTFEGETLVYYKSSEGVKRGFCGTCGATITWDGGQKTVDVSTALFEKEQSEAVAAVEEDWTYLEDEPSYPADARDRVLVEALTKGMRENAGKGR